MIDLKLLERNPGKIYILHWVSNGCSFSVNVAFNGEYEVFKPSTFSNDLMGSWVTLGDEFVSLIYAHNHYKDTGVISCESWGEDPIKTLQLSRTVTSSDYDVNNVASNRLIGYMNSIIENARDAALSNVSDYGEDFLYDQVSESLCPLIAAERQTINDIIKDVINVR